MKNLLIDYSKLKVGQKLWDVRHGEVIVTKIVKKDTFPIKTSTGSSFTQDGKYVIGDKHTSLFLSNPFEQINEFPKVMEVSDNGVYWRKEEVLAYAPPKSRPYITMDGNWIYAREIQKPKELELTLEEIAEKFGVPVETIKIKK